MKYSEIMACKDWTVYCHGHKKCDSCLIYQMINEGMDISCPEGFARLVRKSKLEKLLYEE